MTAITRKEARKAKKLTLKVWGYLAKHGEIQEKEKLPEKLWSQIRRLTCECPLCELFYGINCVGCPLETDAKRACPYWDDWNDAGDDKKDRESAAKALCKAVKRWKIWRVTRWRAKTSKPVQVAEKEETKCQRDSD